MKQRLEDILVSYKNGDTEDSVDALIELESTLRRQDTHILAVQVLFKIVFEHTYLLPCLKKVELQESPPQAREVQFFSSLMAQFIQRHGRDTQTLDHFVQSLPVSSWIVNIASTLLEKQGYFEKSAELYERYVQEKGGYTASDLRFLTDLYTRARNNQQVKRILFKAVEIFDDIPEPYINVAGFYEEQGDKGTAKLNLKKALDLNPHHPSALSRLAYLEDDIEALTSILQLLTDTIKKGVFAGVELEELLYSQGRIYEKKGQYEAAFAAYTAANEEASKRLVAYDSQATEMRLEQVEHRVSQSLKSAKQQEAIPVTPIFIVGGFRSGSTLLEQILVAHPDICGNGEISHVSNYLESNVKDLANIEDEHISGLRQFYLSAIEGLSTTTYHIDKLPTNIWVLDVIHKAIPEAKFIFTNRRKEDMAISTFALQLGQALPYNVSIEDTLHYLGVLERLSKLWLGEFEDEFRVVNYEQLVENIESEVRPIIEWLNIDWSEQLQYFYKSENFVKTASLWDIRKPLTTRQVGRAEKFSFAFKNR